MKYTPSINIAQTIFDPNSYIVTQNAIKVIGNIVNSFNAGVHSFNIIGSYGTGKSNFILALEDSLKNNSKILITNKGQFNGFVRFRFEKIVGDYTSLQRVLTENLFPTEASDNLFENLKSYFKRAEKREEFVILLKSATKLFSVLLASKRPLITELADKLRLKYPLLPTISPCPTMRLEAIRSIIPISCRRYPKSV